MGDYEWFKVQLEQFSKINLSLYKEEQMKRRLTTFRNKQGFTTFKALYQGLIQSKELYEAFLDHMTINVSEFFRNRQRWDILEEKILPPLLQTKKPIKVWSAACSTGEEPYTIAMILSKYVPLSQINILATDIDKNVLEFAQRGLYPERVMKDVPGEIVKKFFVKHGENFQVTEDIRKCVTFKQQNLLHDPFGTQFDLIICRNVLIYFTEDAKQQLYKKFHQALAKQGVLFVGSTEQIFNPQMYGFQVLQSFFYQKL